jgi:hypothetical protein
MSFFLFLLGAQNLRSFSILVEKTIYACFVVKNNKFGLEFEKFLKYG